ncbi:MAG: hypothetical protein AABY43_01635 [Candidatus Omnitrophota bacterium]
MVKKVKSAFLFIGVLSFLFFSQRVFAEKVTILYTGETHSTLYPCECPSGLNGGVSARATKVKEIRKEEANVLLVDSGGVFAGGLLDENSQNVDLDKKRTLINLDAVKIMGYDAIAVGDEEFNFGEDFLKNSTKEKNIPFISANIESDYLLPFLLKQAGNSKIGILALTAPEIKNKLADIKYIEPKEALEKNIQALRAKGADIIIVLSHLGEEEDLNLIKRVEGVDILVCGHRLVNDPNPQAKIANTIILRPAWQGRKLGRIDLTIDKGKILNYAINDIKIDKEIKDDPEVSLILPKCFSDKDCRQKALIGNCENPATLFAKCVFKKPEPVSLLIVKPKSCITCEITRAIEKLKHTFSDINISYLNYETKEGEDLIKKLGIDMLPAYIFTKDIEKNLNFNSFSKFLILKEDKYIIDPSLTGVSFFIGRPKIKNKLDLFISLYDKNSAELLAVMQDFLRQRKEIEFKFHFLGLKAQDKIITPNGLPELEEDLRSICVANKYPDKLWDYLSCRVKNIESSWWDNCLESCGLNINLIKQCSNSSEGMELLGDNLSLSSELSIRTSGVFLLNNQEIFSTVNTPQKKELERIIK